MILLIHENNKPLSVFYNKKEIHFKSKGISNLFFEIASKYPSETLIWCHAKLVHFLNVDELKSIFHHQLIMISYATSKKFIISNSIGYVEQGSPFLNINFDVKYPTWRMSSDIGGMNTDVLNLVEEKQVVSTNFEYFLNSFAKITMPNGLFCYSNPKILKRKYPIIKKSSIVEPFVFKFVKQHYKIYWVVLLILNILIYEKKIAFIEVLRVLFLKNRTIKIDFSKIKLKNQRIDEISKIDVIIPTIGRKKYLYDVLQDLKRQTNLPENVIIVEQNPDVNALSELEYLQTESWPFQIIHHFTHQIGACNARNLALEQIKSNWVFFADDDIRMSRKFIQNSLQEIKKMKVKAITVSCLRENEMEKFNIPFQWGAFGSGCSIVDMSEVRNVKFDMSFEKGFGEDTDFGMQLRNKGIDIIYIPTLTLKHLKAPIGGFRTKFNHPWEYEENQPKPSPTVMLYNQRYKSKEQLLGYKTLLYTKFYWLQEIKNPISYLKSMNKRWDISTKWATKLLNHEI